MSETVKPDAPLIRGNATPAEPSPPAVAVVDPASPPQPTLTLAEFCRNISQRGHGKSPELVNAFYATAKVSGPAAGTFKALTEAFEAFAGAVPEVHPAPKAVRQFTAARPARRGTASVSVRVS